MTSNKLWSIMMMLVLSTTIVFSSCTNDDEEERNNTTSIVGTWLGKITEGNKSFDAKLVVKPETYTVTTPDDYHDFSGTWTDNGDGTLTLTGFFDPTFSYNISGKTLKLKGNGWSAIFTRQKSDDSNNSDSDAHKDTKHEYVDLGLSVKWATCNIGASAPEEYGDYFAWGETEPKTGFGWSNYKWCNGSYKSLTKYCTDSSYGTVDGRNVLEVADDAAAANWGGKWRMPTGIELHELYMNCIWTWTTLNGVNGYKVTGPNRNHIFFPAAGYYYYYHGNKLYDAGSKGQYWTSSQYSNSLARYLYFAEDMIECKDTHRSDGLTIRPVCP